MKEKLGLVEPVFRVAYLKAREKCTAGKAAIGRTAAALPAAAEAARKAAKSR